mmetsp:Transcript_14251/g.39770  ORF Transcript_14251/g.39770 Transcript_14251/m.39770 type:complete len:245 (+) Transcript_14251:1567-2301(+)
MISQVCTYRDWRRRCSLSTRSSACTNSSWASSLTFKRAESSCEAMFSVFRYASCGRMDWSGGALVRESRRVDTSFVCTDWKELVSSECTRDEKVLENRTLHNENLRSLVACDWTPDDDDNSAVTEGPTPTPPMRTSRLGTSTTPPTASSQVQIPSESFSFSVHSTPSVLSYNDCRIFPRADAVVPAMSTRTILTLVRMSGRWADKKLEALVWTTAAGKSGRDLIIWSVSLSLLLWVGNLRRTKI